jgi:hypothetical protein
MVSIKTKVFNTTMVSMFHRRKRRRLFNEIIREQTTSHFYPFIQEATSDLLLNFLRAPEDFLAHITVYVLPHKLLRPLYFCGPGLEPAVYSQVHMGAKLLNQQDSRWMPGNRFLKW